MSFDFSIVMPARNARRTLPEVIRALASQRNAPRFETIVVDDHSTDGTLDCLSSTEVPKSFRALESSGRGAAAARNTGIEAAQGRIVALLGADTVPGERWLAEHAEAHRRCAASTEIAVLGLIEPHRRLRRTAFLDVIHDNGLQFGYPMIDDPDDLPFNFFYSSNISLPRAVLLTNPFDTSFEGAAWEDTELGYRLRRRGVRIVYASDAVVEHDHRMTLASFAARQERSGVAASVLFDLHPELGEFLGIGPDGPPPPLSPPRQLFLRLLTRTTGWLPWRASRYWEALLGHHYLIGLNRGWSARREALGASPSEGVAGG